jgi:cardiolipin synthase
MTTAAGGSDRGATPAIPRGGAPSPRPGPPEDPSTSWFTAANQLTLLRMLLIPAFVLLVVYGEFGWALLVFVIAGLTDALDGLIARLTGQRSDLGAWLDPAADKLLLVTTFIVLTLPNVGLVNRIPIWLTVLVISRDVGIVLTVAIVNLALGPRTFPPSALGKTATAWFILTCVAVMFFNWRGATSPVVDFFVWTSLAITLASGIDYVWRIGRSLR